MFNELESNRAQFLTTKMKLQLGSATVLLLGILRFTGSLWGWPWPVNLIAFSALLSSLLLLASEAFCENQGWLTQGCRDSTSSTCEFLTRYAIRALLILWLIAIFLRIGYFHFFDQHMPIPIEAPILAHQDEYYLKLRGKLVPVSEGRFRFQMILHESMYLGIAVAVGSSVLHRICFNKWPVPIARPRTEQIEGDVRQ